MSGDEDRDEDGFEWHLPGYSFAGPGTNVYKRLELRGDGNGYWIPVNKADLISLQHDLFYYDNNSVVRLFADNLMSKRLEDETPLGTSNIMKDAMLLNRIKRISLEAASIGLKVNAVVLATKKLGEQLKSALKGTNHARLFNKANKKLPAIVKKFGREVLGITGRARSPADRRKSLNMQRAVFLTILGVGTGIISFPGFRKLKGLFEDITGYYSTAKEWTDTSKKNKKVMDKYDKYLSAIGDFAEDGSFVVFEQPKVSPEEVKKLYSDFFEEFQGYIGFINKERDNNYPEPVLNKENLGIVVDGKPNPVPELPDNIPGASATPEIEEFGEIVQQSPTPAAAALDIIKPEIISPDTIKNISHDIAKEPMTVGHINNLLEVVPEGRRLKYLNDYRAILKARGLDLPPVDNTLSPMDAYQHLTEFAWENSKKDLKALSDITYADDIIDRRIITTLSGVISVEQEKQIQEKEAAEERDSTITAQVPVDPSFKAAVVRPPPPQPTSAAPAAPQPTSAARAPFLPAPAAPQPTSAPPQPTSAARAPFLPAPAAPQPTSQPTVGPPVVSQQRPPAPQASREPILPAPVQPVDVVIPRDVPEPGTEYRKDILVSGVNPIDRIVDKLMAKSDAEEKADMIALLRFITPSDQNGGLGNPRNNPLLKGNEIRHNRIYEPADLFKNDFDNTLLSNDQNLLMKKKYNKKALEKKLLHKEGMFKIKSKLKRNFKAKMIPQIQTRAERREFTPAANPPSNYYMGSAYSSFKEANAAQGMPYGKDDKAWWGNDNYSFAPARWQNP